MHPFCDPGGHFCGTPGSSEPDGECDPGYYCEYGVDTQRPTDSSSHTGVGGECTAGSYCPRGTTTPLPCTPGTYNDATGESSTYKVDLELNEFATSMIKLISKFMQCSYPVHKIYKFMPL